MRLAAALLAFPELLPSQLLLLEFQIFLCLFFSLGEARTLNTENLAVWFPRVTVSHRIFLVAMAQAYTLSRQLVQECGGGMFLREQGLQSLTDSVRR